MNALVTAAALWLAGSAPLAQDDVLTTAAASGSFDTLVSLVVAAGLDDALQDGHELTVFAPTDEAFAKLPAETLRSLRLPENRERLAEILKYHVVGEVIRIPEHPPTHRRTSATTLQGQALRFDREGTQVFVDQALVVQRDVRCSNGVVHAIDQVLLPAPPTPNLAELARQAGGFTTLLAAAEAAGLLDALAGGAELTVLAPTDEAFAALPEGTLERLLLPENRPSLAHLLKDHLLAGRVSARDLAAREATSALSGSELPLAIRSGSLEVAGARLLQNDLEASNGLIHVIDRVLLLDVPPTATGANGAAGAEHEAEEWPERIEIAAGWADHIQRDGVRARLLVIRATGGASVELSNVQAHEIETAISGGGTVVLSGSAGSHQARVAGGARLDAQGLATAKTVMTVNGGGEATVDASELLRFSANSGATVRYVDRGASVEAQAATYAKVEVLER